MAFGLRYSITYLAKTHNFGLFEKTMILDYLLMKSKIVGASIVDLC